MFSPISEAAEVWRKGKKGEKKKKKKGGKEGKKKGREFALYANRSKGSFVAF